MMGLHQYANISVDASMDNPMPIYDGENYYIPPRHAVALVPCNFDDPQHVRPSVYSNLLLTRHSFQMAVKTPLIVIYVIHNTTDTGLLLRHGDLLGGYYMEPHDKIRAERNFITFSCYEQLMADHRQPGNLPPMWTTRSRGSDSSADYPPHRTRAPAFDDAPLMAVATAPCDDGDDVVLDTVSR
jgi:hypothetical protein